MSISSYRLPRISKAKDGEAIGVMSAYIIHTFTRKILEDFRLPCWFKRRRLSEKIKTAAQGDKIAMRLPSSEVGLKVDEKM